MPRLDDHTRAPLDAYATTIQPPTDSRPRNRARLLERIAAGDDPPEAAIAPLRPAAGRVRWSFVGIAAAVLVAIGLGWAFRGATPAAPVEPATQAEHTAEETESRHSTQQSPPRAPVSPSASLAPTLDVAPPSLPSQPPTQPPPRRATAKPGPSTLPQKSGPAQPAPPITNSSRLAAEVALISKARGLVTVGEDASALAAFQRHAKEFPRGSLAQERAAWVAVLQCRLGRAAGPRSAATFIGAHPNSPHVARVRKTCSTSVTDPGPTEE